MLGILRKVAGVKDADHVAYVSVETAEPLKRAQLIKLDSHGKAIGASFTDALGIVDPYIRMEDIDKGTIVNLCLFPGSTVSLKHVWKHPAFLDSDEKVNAETTLLSIAQNLGVSLEDLISHAEEYIEFGMYWNQGDRFDGERIPDSFWPAFESYTGITVDGDKRGSFLDCSCG